MIYSFPNIKSKIKKIILLLVMMIMAISCQSIVPNYKWYSTKELVEKSDKLKPGDILYFRPDGKYNHTAVYLGNSLFINASSSKGVILSSMEHSYWSKYFVHGVRVDTASANV